MTGDRSLARSVKRPEKCTFARYGDRLVAVIKARKNIAHAFVFLACFNSNRALPRRRQKFIRVHNNGGTIGKTKTLQSGKREYGRIDFTSVELAQPRFDIASQRQDTQVGTCTHGDSLPAQRGRAEACATRQVGKRTCLASDEDVARVFTLEARREQHTAC